MKYIRHIIALVMFSIVVFTMHQLYKMHSAIKESLTEDVEELFWVAIDRELDDRLNKLNVPREQITGNTPPVGFDKKGLVIKTADKTDFIAFSDSFPTPPARWRYMFLTQSYMDRENPLVVEVLDSLFRKELSNILPDASTLIYCYNRTRGRVRYSKDDTVLVESPIRSSLIKVGMLEELSLQAFVNYPNRQICRTVWSQAYPLLFIVFFILVALVVFICMVGRLLPVITSVNPVSGNVILSDHHPPVKIENGALYYRGCKIVSSNQNLSILKLFLTKPDHTLYHQEIINALWDTLRIVDYQPRLRKCMQRFRVFLESEFPHAELVSIKGEGYSLFIPEEDFHAPEADVPNAPAPYPDKP